MADAAQAYTTLQGTPCWIELPSETVPEDEKERWNHLVKALYGHPDAGTFWEQHSDESVRAMGFEPVGEEWPSVYTHAELQLVLVVYVDDFKMAGPKNNLKKGWELLCEKWIYIWDAISPKLLWFSATAIRSPL